MTHGIKVPQHIINWNKDAVEAVKKRGECDMIGPSDVNAWYDWACYFAHIGHTHRLRWMLAVRNAPRTTISETGEMSEERMGVPTRNPEEYEPGWRKTPRNYPSETALIEKICRGDEAPSPEERARVNAGFAKLQAELREQAGKSKSFGSWQHLGSIIRGDER